MPVWGRWSCRFPSSEKGTTSRAYWSHGALLAVIQQAYVEGVTTMRVDDLVKALACEGISQEPGVTYLPRSGCSRGWVSRAVHWMGVISLPVEKRVVLCILS